MKLHCNLSTLALSPLTPYQFVVAGESPYVRWEYALSVDILMLTYSYRASCLTADMREDSSKRNGAFQWTVMISLPVSEDSDENQGALVNVKVLNISQVPECLQVTVTRLVMTFAVVYYSWTDPSCSLQVLLCKVSLRSRLLRQLTSPFKHIIRMQSTFTRSRMIHALSRVILLPIVSFHQIQKVKENGRIRQNRNRTISWIWICSA